MTTLSIPTQHQLPLPNRPLVLLKYPSHAHLQGILIVKYIRAEHAHSAVVLGVRT